MGYRLSPLAEQDLYDIWLYVARHASVETANRVLELLFKRFELLAEFPGMGRLRPELDPDVRSFAVEKYVIYYRPEDVLQIARVLHGNRDQAAAWKEELAADKEE